MNLIIGLLFAACVGYLAGRLMGVKSVWYINIILGMLGGLVGDLIFSFVGLGSTNFLGEVLVNVVGACVVILVFNKLK